MPAADVDGVVRVIVLTLKQNKRIFTFLRSMITKEVNKTSKDFGTILRANSISTKIETTYTSIL